MDLLQESSSIWDEFLRRPCPQVDHLSFWPRHPWHLLSPDTLGTFCPLTPLIPLVLWYPLSPDSFGTVNYGMVQRDTVLYFGFLIFRWFLGIMNWNEFFSMTTVLYHTILYCTKLYCTEPYFYFSCWYIPLNQAIYAWSFRQKFHGGWWVTLQL